MRRTLASADPVPITMSAEVWGYRRREEDEIHDCVARSNNLRCAQGDRLLKKEGSSHNLFVVLDGTLEVRDDAHRVLGVLTAGDIFGEMAFLLGVPRQRDVIAATEGVAVLSLSEGALRKLIADKPTVSAKLLLNIAEMLCGRLIKARTQPAA